jgi:hypothetical protein
MTISKIRHNILIPLTIMSTENISSLNTESTLAMPSPVDVVSTSEARFSSSSSSSLLVFSPPSLNPKVIKAARGLGHVTIGDEGCAVDSRLVVSVSLFVDSIFRSLSNFKLTTPPPSLTLKECGDCKDCGDCKKTVSFWNSKGYTPANGWVRIVVFVTHCDLDVPRIINMSRELRFLPFLMSANGHNLEPLKDSEAEIYTKFLLNKGFSTSIQNAIAEAVIKDEKLSEVVKPLLQSINKEYYENLPQLMLDWYYTCRKLSKKRVRDCDEDLTEDEDVLVLEPNNKRFKNCKNCNETGHTRPTCTKDCNCGVAPLHQGCSCPSLKKNKNTDNNVI